MPMQDYLQSWGHKLVSRSYSAGSTIFYQGEVPRSAAILLDGVVRVFSISAQGDEQIINFHVAGEFFPVSWLFGQTPGTMFFYEALTDCDIGFISRQSLFDTVLANKQHTREVLDYFATNYTATQIRINGLEQPKARAKILYTLYYLCQRYGIRDGKAVHIPMNLTHQQFAGLIGLTRETTAVEMNRLKKEKIIRYNQQRYVIERDKLLELIGEDTFRQVSIA